MQWKQCLSGTTSCWSGFTSRFPCTVLDWLVVIFDDLKLSSTSDQTRPISKSHNFWNDPCSRKIGRKTCKRALCLEAHMWSKGGFYGAADCGGLLCDPDIWCISKPSSASKIESTSKVLISLVSSWNPKGRMAAPNRMNFRKVRVSTWKQGN